MDIKAILHQNPTDCSYQTNTQETLRNYQKLRQRMDRNSEGLFECGHDSSSFCFDNENLNIKFILHDFALQSHLVTNSQFQQFIADGGTKPVTFGFQKDGIGSNKIKFITPLLENEKKRIFRVHFIWLGKTSPSSSCLQYKLFEANAFAKWSNCRLPTEFEWEVGSRDLTSPGKWNRLEPYGANQLLHNLWC